MTAIGSSLENLGFVPSCSGVFDVWWAI